MNCVLSRKTFESCGIFSNFYADDGSFVCVAAEHSYENPNSQESGFGAKIHNGSYRCVLFSKLYPGKLSRHGYDVYVLTGPGADGHSFELHIGNDPQIDSLGCVLFGREFIRVSSEKKIVTDSKDTFKKFMELQNGRDFILTVE